MRQYIEVATKVDAEEQLRTAHLELQQANEDMRKLLVVVNEEYDRLNSLSASIPANPKNLLSMLPKLDKDGNILTDRTTRIVSLIDQKVLDKFGKQLAQSKKNINLAGEFVDKAQRRLLELT